MRVDDEILLLELGIDRVGEMEKLLDMANVEIGAVTSICESHLERLKDIDTIIEEKSKLLESLSGKDAVGIVNMEGGYVNRLIHKCKVPVLKVGIDQGDIIAQNVLQRNDGTVEFTLNLLGQREEVHLNTLGKHNVTNALIAAAIAYKCGYKMDAISIGLEKYKGFEKRGIKHILPGNITLIDDCYNANPFSMTSAIEFFDSLPAKRKILVAGEMWDLGEESPEYHKQIGGRLAGTSIDTIIFVGPMTQNMISGLEINGGQKNTFYSENADEAYMVLYEYMEEDDTILVKGSRGVHLEKLIEKMLKSKPKLRMEKL